MKIGRAAASKLLSRYEHLCWLRVSVQSYEGLDGVFQLKILIYLSAWVYIDTISSIWQFFSPFNVIKWLITKEADAISETV